MTSHLSLNLPFFGPPKLLLLCSETSSFEQKRSINANKIFVFAIVVLWTIAIMAYCTSERIVRLLDVIWDGWLLKGGRGRFKYPIAHSNPSLDRSVSVSV